MFLGELGVLKWLEQCRTPFLNQLMETITLFGEDTILIVLICVLYFIFHKETAYRLCFLTVCSIGLNGIFKNLLKIPRPFLAGGVSCVRPETATGYSFPSGHTQTFATWSTVAARMTNKRKFLVTAIILSLLLGFSRMYLGAHYPSDVAAGLVLGISVGIFGNALYEKQKDPKKLYFPVFLVMTIFGIFFLCNPDPHFADYFKCLGLMGGLWASSHIDGRCQSMTYQVPFYKKLLRVIVAIMLALILKTGMNAVPVPENLSLSLVWDFIRHAALITVVLGVYPLLLPKIKL